MICLGTETKGSKTQTVSWHPQNRRKRPPPLILEEDALCSEHSWENLWQHQRVAERFSNCSANERRPSCMSVITAASLRGKVIRCTPIWKLLPLGARVLRTHIHWRSGLSAVSDWVKSTALRTFDLTNKKTIMTGFYCKTRQRYDNHVERRLHVKSASCYACQKL